MYKRLSPQDNMVLYLDVNARKRSGMLERVMGTKDSADADYRRFVERTGFGYRDHLHHAMIGFAKQGRFMLLRGEFEWRRLRASVKSQGGS